MSESELKYVGPLPTNGQPRSDARDRLRGLPWPFLLVVALPTLVTAIYLLMIATPRYVSEAQFIVRQGSSQQPNSLGVALQGVGLSPAQTEAFAVHEYMTSRDGLRAINSRNEVADALARPGVDFLSRRPAFWQKDSFENLYKGFQSYLTVGYDSTTGISTIRVQAFRPEDAQRLNAALLANGEQLVNRLNQRAMRDAVSQGQQSVTEAETRLAAAQLKLGGFRDRERFIDPDIAARESSQLISTLSATLATLNADKSQILLEAPQSPQLPLLNNRIRAYESQIAQERAKVAGATNSLAPKVGAFEALSLEQELAARAITNANLSLDSARQEARRQHLYLEQVVSPNIPDSPAEPRRWYLILTVFLTSLVIYGLGWLVVAGVREHRQD